MEARRIIKKYLTTEKSATAKETQGKYTFEVDRWATKHQIKEAVEKLFNIDVASVHTVVMPGKVKRLGRFAGKTPRWKKAIVEVKGEARIAEFENL